MCSTQIKLTEQHTAAELAYHSGVAQMKELRGPEFLRARRMVEHRRASLERARQVLREHEQEHMCEIQKPFCSDHQIAMPNAEYGLSFSARDLLMRLVRENRAIRGKITALSEPLWLHHGGYPEPAVQIADVLELLDHGLIEFSAKWFQRGEELYKPSQAGIRAAGLEAVADAKRSAAIY
jgi:hypothetical protein